MKSPASLLCCLFLLAALLPTTTTAFSFVTQTQAQRLQCRPSFSTNKPQFATKKAPSRFALSMIDQNVIFGGGIAVLGLATGIGLVAFAENMGERARQRGSGLSDSMSTRIVGGLMEDVEVSSVSDLGSLTSQLEQALKETGGESIDEASFEMTEEDKKRIAEEADDGW